MRRRNPPTAAAPRCSPLRLEAQVASRSNSRAIYWTVGAGGAPGEGEIQSVGLDGGSPRTLASGLNWPIDIAVDDGFVYWDEYGTGLGDGRIARVPLGGGTLQVLASAPTGPVAMAKDSSYVYWASVNGDDPMMRVPLDGGTATPFDPTNVHGPNLCAPQAGYLYWAGTDTAVIGRTPLDGGNEEVLARHGLEDFAVNASGQAFWADNVSGTVGRVNPDGGITTLYGGGGGPYTISLDAQYAYVGTHDSKQLFRIPLQGGTPETIAATAGLATSIATDDTFVYWADNVVLSEDAGTVFANVYKAAK